MKSKKSAIESTPKKTTLSKMPEKQRQLKHSSDKKKKTVTKVTTNSDGSITIELDEDTFKIIQEAEKLGISSDRLINECLKQYLSSLKKGAA